MFPEPAVVHWGINGWQNLADVATENWGLGHVALISTAKFKVGDLIDFTIYWPNRDVWQNEDFQITLVEEGTS